MTDYPYPLIKEKINDKDVCLVGVAHDYSFFKEHESYFEDIVSKHDAIVLEQSLGGDFWDSDFFGWIGDIAHSKKKRVYQADPMNWSIFELDAWAWWIGINLIFWSIAYKPRKKISRREFLIRSALIGSGASMVFGTTPMRIFTTEQNLEMVLEYGIDDFLLYGETDYRNIKIAEGIERICNEVDYIKSLATIHGAAHHKTVDFYLKNPYLRSKKLAYFPHEIVGNTKIREYVPDGDRWTLVRSF